MPTRVMLAPDVEDDILGPDSNCPCKPRRFRTGSFAVFPYGRNLTGHQRGPDWLSNQFQGRVCIAAALVSREEMCSRQRSQGLQDREMTVWIYVDTRKIGDKDHLRVFASSEAAETWFGEHDPEGVAFEYPMTG
jgi:hypothetical protein